MADYWELFYKTGAPAWYLLHAAQNRAQEASEQQKEEQPCSKPENT